MKSTVFAQGNTRTIEKLRKLRKQSIADKASRVALRIHGIILSLDKRSVAEIAKILDVHRTTVHDWIQGWNQYRELALLEGFRCGRPTRLSESQKEHLKDIIESGPVAYGLNTGVWTSPIISQIIEDEFQVNYHPGHVRKLLKQIGFSLQRPTTTLVQADPQQQRRWVRYTYPRLKKTPKPKKP